MALYAYMDTSSEHLGLPPQPRPSDDAVTVLICDCGASSMWRTRGLLQALGTHCRKCRDLYIPLLTAQRDAFEVALELACDPERILKDLLAIPRKAVGS